MPRGELQLPAAPRNQASAINYELNKQAWGGTLDGGTAEPCCKRSSTSVPVGYGRAQDRVPPTAAPRPARPPAAPAACWAVLLLEAAAGLERSA